MQVIDSQKETNLALANKALENEKYAELGRLAVKVFNINKGVEEVEICTVIKQTSWKGNNEICGGCEWKLFCKKRAELPMEVQK